MPRPRQEQLYADTLDQIKRVARQQMRASGTAGLSLRAIAREMNVTAPALYHYFPRLDDLITALIIDAFNGLADAVQDAATQSAARGESVTAQFKAALLAYRGWAVANPIDFQLIYGNPIPGYVAPAEVTVPLSSRPFVTLGELLVAARTGGHQRHAPPSLPLPDRIAQHMANFHAQYAISTEDFAILTEGWTRIHGVVMLELFEHLPPLVGDVARYYEHIVDTLIHEAGLD